jgi:hypothetical protein
LTDSEFEQYLSDREILVLIADRTRSMKDTLVDHERRLRVVEDAQTAQRGALSGAKALWTLLLGLPAGFVAALFYKQ